MDQELVSRIAATAKSNLQLPDEQLPFFQGGHLRRFHQTGHQNRIGNLTYLPK